MAQVTQNVGGKKRKSYEEHLRELHKNDDRPGNPTSTTQKAQNKSTDSSSRNYIKEAFDKYTGGDYSKIKATNLAGEVILDRMRGNTKWTKEGAMKEHKASAQLNGKGNWTKEGAMAERRAAAQKKKEWAKSNEDQYRTSSGVWQNPNGKKKTFDKQQVMADRRAAAQAAGKGNWNAQEEMRKRREAAMAKKKGK